MFPGYPQSPAPHDSSSLRWSHLLQGSLRQNYHFGQCLHTHTQLPFHITHISFYPSVVVSLLGPRMWEDTLLSPDSGFMLKLCSLQNCQGLKNTMWRRVLWVFIMVQMSSDGRWKEQVKQGPHEGSSDTWNRDTSHPRQWLKVSSKVREIRWESVGFAALASSCLPVTLKKDHHAKSLHLFSSPMKLMKIC